MNNKKQKFDENQINFVTMIEEIRGELTGRISDISSTSEMNGENVKLLKEMTSIVKELDRLVKENRENDESDESEQLKFLMALKEKSIIKN